jgi:hypothetical protein
LSTANPARWLSIVPNSLGLVAVVWAIPVAIVVVGLPIALLFLGLRMVARLIWPGA